MGVATADDPKSIVAGLRLIAHDSLAPIVDDRPDASDCIDGLRWVPTEFDVSIDAAIGKHGDWLVRFPSPIPTEDLVNDRVAMEWCLAKDKSKNPILAPAVVIVHESGSGMTVGRLIASGLSRKGVHSFMLQLPHYGLRRGPQGKPTGNDVFQAMKQGVADVRRARDAVAKLPYVDASKIGLQGTSLGGFVASTSGSLDGCFHRVFILLAGGDLHEILMKGKKDAENLRDELARSGIDDAQLQLLLNGIEPLRLAHRLNPTKTWLFSGMYDDVVPIENARRLANAIGLDPAHHVIMEADHYSGIVFMPTIAKTIVDELNASP